MKDEIATILTRDDLTSEINTRLDWAYEDVADAKEWQVLLIEDKNTALSAYTEDYSLPSTLRTAKYITLADDTSSKLSYDARTVAFTVDATLTGGTSGATGVISSITVDSDTSTGTLTLGSITGTFQDNEIITDDDGTIGSATVRGALRCVVRTQLRPEDIGEWHDSHRNLEDGDGQPKVYTLVGNKIRLQPIPSTTEETYKLYIIGHKKVSYFSGDDDTTDLDQKLDRAIIYRAAQFCYDDLLEENEEALRYKNKADEAVDNAFADELAYSAL